MEQDVEYLLLSELGSKIDETAKVVGSLKTIGYLQLAIVAISNASIKIAEQQDVVPPEEVSSQQV